MRRDFDERDDERYVVFREVEAEQRTKNTAHEQDPETMVQHLGAELLSVIKVIFVRADLDGRQQGIKEQRRLCTLRACLARSSSAAAW